MRKIPDLTRYCSFIFYLVLTVFLLGCQDEDRVQPYQIGIIGSLTGRDSQMGIDRRRGAQLMVEWLNENGGVNGIPLELVVKDDMGQVQGAVDAFYALLERGVDGIIGPQTSGLTEQIIAEANSQKRVVISSSATSQAFSSRDDYFFRVVNDTRDEALALGIDILKLHEGSESWDGVVIIDTANEVYTRVWAESLLEFLQNNFGIQDRWYEFSSNLEVDNASLAKRLTESHKPDVIIIGAGALDTAILAQHLFNGGYRGLVVGSRWARIGELIYYGGEGVEGMIFSEMFAPGKSFHGDYEWYHDRFINRFGVAPDYASVHASEAVLLWYLGFLNIPRQRQRNATSPGMDQQAIRGFYSTLGGFQGLQDWIDLLPTGDSKRPQYSIIVRNGQYETRP